MDSTISSPRKSTLLIGVISLVVAIFLSTLFGFRLLVYFTGAKTFSAELFFATRFFFWACLGGIWIYALKVEKQKLLIWEEKKYSPGIFLLSIPALLFVTIAVVFLVGIILAILGLSKESKSLETLLSLFRAHPFLIYFTAITAGVTEEMTFRGYILPRLNLLLKSPVAAVVVSSVLFGLLHFGYGTIGQMVIPFVIGFVFAVYYWKFRNIKVVIICHVLWDIAAISVRLWAEQFHLHK